MLTCQDALDLDADSAGVADADGVDAKLALNVEHAGGGGGGDAHVIGAAPLADITSVTISAGGGGNTFNINGTAWKGTPTDSTGVITSLAA
jgi:hypothetical protein